VTIADDLLAGGFKHLQDVFGVAITLTSPAGVATVVSKAVARDFRIIGDAEAEKVFDVLASDVTISNRGRGWEITDTSDGSRIYTVVAYEDTPSVITLTGRSGLLVS